MRHYPGPIAQSVVYLITDPGVWGWILAWPKTFVEIDRGFFFLWSLILLLPPIEEEIMSVTRERMCTEYWLST